MDIGSGKGRVLLVAADFPLRRIIGVEFSEALHRIAETNLRVYRGHKQRCFDLSSVHARAEDFALPDGNWVLYFFNPFGEDTMTRVLANVARAWQKSPRTISLLFFHLRFRSVVE